VQPLHEKSSSSSARPNDVERATVLPDVVAQRERWAKLA
jgi:hypothetical protein